jgi:HAMP domain-containing protein
MHQRTIWIIAGVAALAVLFCAALAGIGGFFVIREVSRQQQQLADLRATISAGTLATTPPTMAGSPMPMPEEPPATSTPIQPATPLPPQLTPAASAGPIPDPAAGPSDVAPALVPELQGALAQHPGATLYRIGARLDPDRRTIAGEQIVRLTNTEDAPLNEIYFRLYVNAPHYNEGGIVVDDVRVDGQPAATHLEIDDTALKVALPQPLAQGQRVEIGMRFTTSIPTSGGGYGIFNLADGVFALYNWHPELAVYEDGGWQLNPVTRQGDPTNTDAANYAVAFTVPQGYEVVTSGLESARPAADGQVTYQIASALTRNFVVVASDRFAHATQQAGAVSVNSYYLPGDEWGGKAVLATAARAIELFSQRFGPYPYPELDVAEVALGGGAAGMESTGLIMIGSAYYDPAQAAPLAGSAALIKGADKLSVLDFVTAHETAHQWWYGIVGSDAYQQPWLDESLTNWSAAFYIDQTAGADTGLLARDLFIAMPYRMVLERGDERLDQPVDQFSEEEYSAIVYGKGAVMYDVLRGQIGDAPFFEFLRRYYQEHQFERVDGAGWQATLAQVAGQDVAATFYQQWVEGDGIRASDLPPGGPLSELLGGFGGLGELLPTPTPE